MKKTELVCPNLLCAKPFDVYDTVSFKCSSCGTLIRVEVEGERWKQRVFKEEMATSKRKSRIEFISSLHLKQLGAFAMAGFLLRPVAPYLAALSFASILGLIYARFTRKLYTPLLRLAVYAIVGIVLCAIIGDLADPPAARCADGTYSYSSNNKGTCSWHGGVEEWDPGPWWH